MTSRIHAGRPTWRPVLAIIAAAVVVAGAWAGFRHDAWAGTIAAALFVLALAGWFFAYHRYVWAKRTEEQYRVIFNNSNDAVFVFGLGEDRATNFIQVNDVACQRLGYTREELLERSMRDLHAPGTLDFASIMQRLLAGDQWLFETEHLTRDGRGIPTEINARAFLLGGQRTVLAVARDITERKRAERYQDLSAEILGALNEPLGVRDAVDRILAAIKRETGFDAVGIRLRSGDDFPYFVQNGFSPDFLLTENTLIARMRTAALAGSERQHQPGVHLRPGAFRADRSGEPAFYQGRKFLDQQLAAVAGSSGRPGPEASSAQQLYSSRVLFGGAHSHPRQSATSWACCSSMTGRRTVSHWSRSTSSRGSAPASVWP